MTADEFLHWRLDKEGAWELVDGAPRLKFDNGPRLMAGGTVNHAQVAANIVAALRPRLRGSASRPFGSDLAVRNLRGEVRQPDATVLCGPRGGGDLDGSEPVALFEVLSPSTRRGDLLRKSEEYRQLASAACVAFLEADQPRVYLWTREGLAWRFDEVSGIDAELPIEALSISVPLKELYEDVDLAEASQPPPG